MRDQAFEYNVGLVNATSGTVFSMSSAGQAVAGGAEYLINFQTAVNDLLLQSHIARGMKKLRPEIARLMPPRRKPLPRSSGPVMTGAATGVMVVVHYISQEEPNTGLVAKEYKTMWVQGAAPFPLAAIRRMQEVGVLVDEVPGWTKNLIYMWLTP